MSLREKYNRIFGEEDTAAIFIKYPRLEEKLTQLEADFRKEFKTAKNKSDDDFW